ELPNVVGLTRLKLQDVRLPRTMEHDLLVITEIAQELPLGGDERVVDHRARPALDRRREEPLEVRNTARVRMRSWARQEPTGKVDACARFVRCRVAILARLNRTTWAR